MKHRPLYKLMGMMVTSLLVLLSIHPAWGKDEDASAIVLADEQAREKVIQQVTGSVVAIFGSDPKAGGGSGVIITSDGQALTNFHVVAAAGWQGMAGIPGTPGAPGAGEPGVPGEGRLVPWRLIGVDAGGDLALIKLESDQPLRAAMLGDSRGLRPGAWVMTMGNGFNLASDFQPGVSLGVLSGVERYQPGEPGEPGKQGEGGGELLRYGHCLQVDAAINPGNSGGPLFDMQGQVIGIVGRASFAERGRVNVGLGYAISAEQVKLFLPWLRKGGLVHHGRLGARFADRDGQVICDALERDMPLAGAGLELGDRLLRFGEYEIRSADHFTGLLSMYPAGAEVEVVWEHQGQWRSSKVVLMREDYPEQGLAKMGWPPAKEAWAPAPMHATVTDVQELVEPVRAATMAKSPWEAVAEASWAKVVKIEGGAIGMATGYASGIIVGPKGQIVTALAALTTADRIMVSFADGTRHAARLVKRSDALQVVLLQVEAETPNYFELSRHATADAQGKPRLAGAEQGDWVLALTHAFGVAQGDEKASVNLGIVSWRGKLDLKRRMQDWAYQGEALLTDAGISNPGAAGGALVSAQGQLIGMVGKMAENRQTGTRVNFAIPVDQLAMWVTDSPANHHAADVAPTPEPAGDPVDTGIRLFTQGGESSPAYVERVVRNSPASIAGVRADDLLLSLQGKRVADVTSAGAMLRELHFGEPVELVVQRDGRIITLKMVLR